MPARSNPFEIDAVDADALLRGFGNRGLHLKFASRVARHKANHGLEEEVYLLRRYMFTLLQAGRLSFPLRVSAQESPDFLMIMVGKEIGIEITEATSKRDQREFTLAERACVTSLLGTHGGRYPDGADGDQPERDVTADVLRAIRRKVRKIRKGVYTVTSEVELLIYANSNASFLSDKSRAIEMIKSFLFQPGSRLLAGTSIARVAVIVGSHLALYDKDRVQVFPIEVAAPAR